MNVSINKISLLVEVIHDLDQIPRTSMSATFIQGKRNPFVLSESKVRFSTLCMGKSKYEWIARRSTLI